jgi:hypothetical protein
LISIHLEVNGSVAVLSSVYLVDSWALFEWIIINDVRPWVAPCHASLSGPLYFEASRPKVDAVWV